MSSDHSLLEQAKTGDKEAFGALMVRYQDKVFRLALRLTGDQRDAEDVTQETFLQVYRKLGSFRGDAQFSTWLYRVATNTALMRLRSERPRTASLEDCLPHFDEQGRHARLDVNYSEAARVEQTIQHQQLSRMIHDALARLPDLYRGALVLYDLEELSAGEAAEILGVDPATLRQRVHRARLMLRGHLGALAGKERM